VQGRKIKIYDDLPEGKGDAKQFVRERYEQAAKKIKNTQTILVVARDADNETYNNAKKEFNPINDKIFLVIPKRNLETWFYFLDNQNDKASKDETTDRKNSYHRAKPTKYGEKLEDIINQKRQNLSSLTNMPDSLEETILALLKREKL
jgi:hypothetical protein